MKRSDINQAYLDALSCFKKHGWHLPPNPRWDITDCGLGRFNEIGLVLINLSEELEYCEKLMYARENQVTPMHTHRVKKEDIICREGQLAIELWNVHPKEAEPETAHFIKRNNEASRYRNGEPIILKSGERVTLNPGVYHSFWPVNGSCIIGEISTANDDANDNFFTDPNVGRFPKIEEDEAPLITLVSE